MKKLLMRGPERGMSEYQNYLLDKFIGVDVVLAPHGVGKVKKKVIDSEPCVESNVNNYLLIG